MKISRMIMAVSAVIAFYGQARAALPEFAPRQAMTEMRQAVKDSRYEMTKKEARHSLDQLKNLAEYAKDVLERSEKLREEMLGRRYDDWVNVRLLPDIAQIRALREGLTKTHGLEKTRVSADLKKAKAGDYGPLEQDIARINQYRVDNKPAVDEVAARIHAVMQDYRRHYGNALAALAKFNGTAPVPELLNSKPQLVEKIFLEPITLRPLEWRIVLQKKDRNYNDPRFRQVPSVVAIENDQERLTYPVVVR
ncbi:MAG: hypothetical protein HY551_03840 [Elusimicrobia bacterium]|nr:hypothetical protein [Elusimicrobiota bacterium]